MSGENYEYLGYLGADAYKQKIADLEATQEAYRGVVDAAISVSISVMLYTLASNEEKEIALHRFQAAVKRFTELQADK